MIEYRGVTKTYGDEIAVDRFSLTIPTGQLTVLVGSSGSGKTTLLRMVNRMVAPSSGQVLIDGEDVADRDPVMLRRSIGYVLQQGGLLPHRTVLDNIATVPRLLGERRASARNRAIELLELMGLDAELGDRYPAHLSGGQQQRVGVARALAADPDILLMDEPFGAVDPLVRRDLQNQLLELHRRLGKTILFVTHDIDEAFTLGEQVVVLRAGAQIAQQGAPNQIAHHPANEFVAEFIAPKLRMRNAPEVS